MNPPTLSSAIVSYCLWHLSVFNHVGDIDVYLSLPNLRHSFRNELFAGSSVLATALFGTVKKLNIYSSEVLNKFQKEKRVVYPELQPVLIS